MDKIVKIFFVVGLIFFFSYKIGDSQPIVFEKSYGGSLDELGHSVVQTPDSGFIAVGFRYSFLRTNKYGDTIFTKRGSAADILRTIDNNYVIIAFDGITKRDINSNIIWQRSPYNVNATIFKIREAYNKGFIISGEVDRGTYSLPYILKIDSVGFLEWQIVYDNLFNGLAYDIIQTPDGGYAFTGSYNQGPYIIKADSVGTIQWFKNYGNIASHSSSILKLGTGYIICGNPVIIRVDEEGNVIWNRIYLLGSNNYTGLNKIIETFDGGFALTGERDTTSSFKNIPSLLLLKIDSSGNEQWNRLFGYVDSINGGNVGNDIKQTFDSGFVMTGKTCGNNFSCNADLFLVKTDKYGNSPIVNISNVYQSIPLNFILYQNYPNPFNPITKITFDIPKQEFVSLKVYDLLGKEVLTLVNETKQGGSYEIEFNGSDLASGVYFYRLESGEFNLIKSMVLIK